MKIDKKYINLIIEELKSSNTTDISINRDWDRPINGINKHILTIKITQNADVETWGLPEYDYTNKRADEVLKDILQQSGFIPKNRLKRFWRKLRSKS